MTTALITGHTGFVGRHLVRHLEQVHQIQAHGFSLSNGRDVRDYEAIRRIIDRLNPDLIFHLAAQAYVPESGTAPYRGLEINVAGTLNLLEAIRHTGCRARVLIAGTSEEYGYDHPPGTVLDEQAPVRPTTMYGVAKLAAGQAALVYARTYSMSVVVTRAWNHTGPGQSSVYAVPAFARKIAEIEAKQRKYLSHGNLEAVRHYLDVRDVVHAYTLAIQHEPGIYNVCGPAANTVIIKEILDSLIGMSRTHPITTEHDPGLYRPGMQTGSAEFPTPNCGKLTSLTGWSPAHTLNRTLADTLSYWRERVNAG